MPFQENSNDNCMIELVEDSFTPRESECKRNKNAFQWDVFCPLVDHIPACTAQEGGVFQYTLGRGMSAQGCLPGGYLPGGVADTLPVNRMTDRCKNVTLPQLRCGG